MKVGNPEFSDVTTYSAEMQNSAMTIPRAAPDGVEALTQRARCIRMMYSREHTIVIALNKSRRVPNIALMSFWTRRFETDFPFCVTARF
jgi:hypothetical protein